MATKEKNKTTRKSKLLMEKYSLTRHSNGLFLIKDHLCKDRAGEFMLEFEGDLLDVLESASRFPQAKYLTVEGEGYSHLIGTKVNDKGENILAKHFVRARFLVRTNQEMKLFLKYLHEEETRTFVSGLADVKEFPMRTKGVWTKKEARQRIYSPTHSHPTFFPDRKLNWLIIDDDGIKIPETNLIEDIQTVIKQKRTMLKYIFQVSNMVISLSSKYGVPDEEGNAQAKIHVFMRLKETVLLSEAKALIAGINSKKYAKFDVEFDKSVLTPVQPIYEGPPVFVDGKDTLGVTELIRYKSFDSTSPKFILDNFRDILVFDKKSRRRKGKGITPQEEQFHLDLIEQLKTGGEDGGYMLCPGVLDKDGNTVMEGEPLLRSEPIYDDDGNLVSYEVLCYLAYMHSSDGANSSLIKVNGQEAVFICSHTVSHANDEPNIYKQFEFLIKCGVPPKFNITNKLFLGMSDEFPRDLNSQVSEWNMKEIQENYIYVRGSDAYFSKYDGIMMPPRTVKESHPEIWLNEEDKQAGNKPKAFTRTFTCTDLNYAGGQSVTGELFVPSTKELIIQSKGLYYLNAFRGFYIQPVQGDTSAFYEHMSVICPNPKEAEAFTDYIAHIFQKPGERPMWSPVHVSVPQGLGRGLLNTLVGNMCEPFTSTVTPDDMFNSQFNEYLKNSLWVGVEETATRGNSNVSSILKHVVTMTRGTINLKNKSKLLNYPVATRFFFMTNELDALPLEESDRRFWVIGPDDLSYKPRARSYYKPFVKLIEDERFQSAVMYDLLHRDISKFMTEEIPFSTRLKEDMQHISSSPEKKALDAISSCGYFPRLMTVTAIKNLIIDCLNETNQYVHEDKITAAIYQLPQYKGGKPVSVNNKKKRFRVLGGFKGYKNFDARRLNAYLETFQNKEIPMKWWEE